MEERLQVGENIPIPLLKRGSDAGGKEIILNPALDNLPVICLRGEELLNIRDEVCMTSPLKRETR